MSEAWAWERSAMSCNHFQEGVVLLMAHILEYLGEAFQYLSHLCCIRIFFFWHIAEML